MSDRSLRHPGISLDASLGFRWRHEWRVGVIPGLVIFLLAGCGGSGDVAGEDGQSASDQSLLREDGELQLDRPQLEGLGVTWTTVTNRMLQHQLHGVVQVFESAAGKSALASGQISWPASDLLKDRPVLARWREKEFRGFVTSARSVSLLETDDVEVVVALADAGGHLELGSFLSVQIDLGAHEAEVCVPESAVVGAALGDFAYVVHGDRLQRVSVTRGIADPPWVEITSGLRVGQEVVGSGAEALWLLELSEVGGMANLK